MIRLRLSRDEVRKLREEAALLRKKNEEAELELRKRRAEENKARAHRCHHYGDSTGVDDNYYDGIATGPFITTRSSILIR